MLCTCVMGKGSDTASFPAAACKTQPGGSKSLQKCTGNSILETCLPAFSVAAVGNECAREWSEVNAAVSVTGAPLLFSLVRAVSAGSDSRAAPSGHAGQSVSEARASV